MTLISVTIPDDEHQVKLQLRGVTAGYDPIDTLDGSVASSYYNLIPNDPFGTGLLTTNVVGNDRIEVNGMSGTYYRMTIYAINSDVIYREADFEIVGDTFDLDTATPLLETPIPGVVSLPNLPAYASKAYVDAATALLQPISQKALSNGYASLDGTGKVPSGQLPSLSSTLAGDTDVAINSPANSDILTYNISTGKWQNHQPTVISVAGRSGAIVLGENDIAGLVSDLAAKVATNTTINTHALTGNIVISASDLTTGTLPHAQLPALLAGDIPNIAESQVTNLVSDLASKLPLAGGTLSGAVTFASQGSAGTFLHINDNDAIAQWSVVEGAFPNSYGDTRNNQVMRMGWNIGNGGRDNVSEPAHGIEMEDYYLASAGQLHTGQMEFHIVYYGTSGSVIRTFSYSADRATDYVSLSTTHDDWSIIRRSDAAQMVKFDWSNPTTGNITFVKNITLTGQASGVLSWQINGALGSAQFNGSIAGGTAGVSNALSFSGLSTQGPNLLALNNEHGLVFSVAPNGGVSMFSDTNFQSATAIFGANQGVRINSNGPAMASAGALGWSSTTHAYDTFDTGVSRSAAGVVAIGTGAQGNAGGTLKSTIVNALTGYQVNGAAASGHYLRGNGTNYVDSVIAVGDFPVVNSAGFGGFVSAGRINFTGGEIPGNPASQPAAFDGVANHVYAWQFTLPCTFQLGRASSTTVTAAGSAGSTFGFAIYDKNQNRICQATGFDGTNTSTPQSVTFSTVTLPPGTYYFAQTASDINIKLSSLGGNNIRQMFGSLSPSGFNRIGTAVNSFSAGSFPAALGGLDGSNQGGGATMFWEA